VKVLVVDDDLDLLALILRTARGYLVVEARTGASARRVRRGSPTSPSST
jgi:hypothetical protein